MRLTGQATTALGNFITNMQVHAKFVCDNYDNIVLILGLGDDNLMLTKGNLDTSKLKNYVASAFNMQTEEKFNEDHGTFC